MSQYPEVLTSLPDALFVNACKDHALMLAPHATANDAPGWLFANGGSDVVEFRLGGDAGLNDATGTVTLPLPKTVVTVGTHYGMEESYTAEDPTQNVPTICEIVIPFTVWGSSAVELAEVKRRLLFARDKRAAVFASYGLTLMGRMVPERRRAFDIATGLLAEDHRWHFYWERT